MSRRPEELVLPKEVLASLWTYRSWFDAHKLHLVFGDNMVEGESKQEGCMWVKISRLMAI